MSIETTPTLTRPDVDTSPGSDVELQDACEQLWQEDDSAEELQRVFREIVKPFEEENLLDLQQYEIERLEKQKEILLGSMLDNPTKAFKVEFEQLMLLFEGRSENYVSLDGSKSQLFCTQDHDKKAIDYLFSKHTYPSGHDKYEIRKTYDLFGSQDEITCSWENDELRVTARTYRRGIYEYQDLDEDKRERVLAQLFFDTVRASAEQFKRTPDEIARYDEQAKRYLIRSLLDEQTR